MTTLYLALSLLAPEPAVFICPNTLLELGRAGNRLMYCPLAREVLERGHTDV